MSQESIEELRAQLQLERKKLELIEAIDHIRDTSPNPATMLTNIVNVLTDHLHADFCMLSLLDRETGEPELKAINDRSQEFGQLSQAITREMVKQAANISEVTIWDGAILFSEEVLAGFAKAPMLAVVPIIMGEKQRLGAMLLARVQERFSPDDLDLLRTAESQIDSAVIQGYTHNELQQHVKELETIYRIDRIRDQSPSFDEMLNAILRELCHVIEAEMGFAMLYDHSGKRLELRASTHHDLFSVSPFYETIAALAIDSLSRAELLVRNTGSNGMRSVMCMPLIMNERVIGVLGVVNRYGPEGFNSDDRRLLKAIGSQMDTAIFENIEKRRLKQVLGRSVDPRIMSRLLKHPEVDFLKGERAVLTVLYADLRGSTSLAERLDPETLVSFINHYLEQMTDVILSHEGTLDKFVGDEVMALFGAPFPQEDHALRAVRVGLAMQRAHQLVMNSWHHRQVEVAPIGVGIATGELIVGEMGCPQRADYTVIGKAANLGARICSAATAGEVLISEETYALVKESIVATPRPGMRFKGVEREMTVYAVTDLL